MPFWVETGYVFTTCNGVPLDPRNFHRAFKARLARAEVVAADRDGVATCVALATGREGAPGEDALLLPAVGVRTLPTHPALPRPAAPQVPSQR